MKSAIGITLILFFLRHWIFVRNILVLPKSQIFSIFKNTLNISILLEDTDTNTWLKKRAIENEERKRPWNSLSKNVVNFYSPLLRIILTQIDKQLIKLVELMAQNKLRPATLLKKETLAQVFSCEFCKMFKNTFLTEHLRTTASASSTHKITKYRGKL